MQHIVRLFNTNIDGTKKVAYSITKIRGIGRRIGHAITTQAKVDTNKFAGELNQEEINRLVDVINNPLEYGIPNYMLNNQKDYETGEDQHLVGIKLDGLHRMLIERGKKHGEVRKCRLAMGLKVRGQHTNANGRRKKVFGKKK